MTKYPSLLIFTVALICFLVWLLSTSCSVGVMDIHKTVLNKSCTTCDSLSSMSIPHSALPQCNAVVLELSRT